MEETNWQPEATAPQGRWLRTRLDGEDGESVSCLRVWPDEHGGDREWIAKDGRTTITHHSYAAPSHWAELAIEGDTEAPKDKP